MPGLLEAERSRKEGRGREREGRKRREQKRGETCRHLRLPDSRTVREQLCVV
jgi:hypothetical protein